MSLKRKFASGAAWNVAGMSFEQLASFAIFVMLSRILSPNEFGLVAFASIFVDVARPLIARGASVRNGANRARTSSFMGKTRTGQQRQSEEEDEAQGLER